MGDGLKRAIAAARGTMPMTANELTAALLIEIPKRFPNVRVWRQNTGGGIGMSTVKQAVALIRSGQYAKAISLLLSRPIKWGVEGAGDISGLHGPHGRRIEIEIKADGDKQSEQQRAFQSMVERLGGVYILARDVEGCLMELDGIGQPC